jgi:RsiW-degrading membrane proteinase PrsW (M82 family)
VHELTVIYGSQRVVLQPGQVGKVGRGDDCNAVVDDPHVSRNHLRLTFGAHGWVLENTGRSGTFIYGRQVSQFALTQPVEARLASPDGPAVLLQPDGAALQPQVSPAAVAPGAPQPAAAPPPPPYAGAPPPPPGVATPPAGVAPPPAGGQPVLPGPAGWGVRPDHLDKPSASPEDFKRALHILFPIRAWLSSPELRHWYRLAVAVYALVPVILVQALRTSSLETLGWAYSLYIAPLWAAVFWYLIKPGRITKTVGVIAAVVVGAELVLIPVLTLPWENALAPASGSTNLISWIVGVGLAEEVTKDLPVLVLAFGLYQLRGLRLDPRMWMFIGSLSGLMFGVYEASTKYIANVVQLGNGLPTHELLDFAERILVDGFQHAVWAGIACFFIGLGVNYHRQRIPLWIFGIAVPSVLHGLNDWSLSGYFGNSWWQWVAIQAFSLFLFLGYSATAASIEREVRHTPLFRGQSIYMDPLSQSQAPPPPR